MKDITMYGYIDSAILSFCRKEPGIVEVLELCEGREIIHLSTIGHESGGIESLFLVIYAPGYSGNSQRYAVRLWARVTDKGAQGVHSRIFKHKISVFHDRKEERAS